MEFIFVRTIVAVCIVALMAIVVRYLMRKNGSRKKSEHLRQRFGREYDRAVSLYNDRRRAEYALESREARIREFEVRRLSDDERGEFLDDWRTIEALWSNNPAGALSQADRLVIRILHAQATRQWTRPRTRRFCRWTIRALHPSTGKPAPLRG